MVQVRPLDRPEPSSAFTHTIHTIEINQKPGFNKPILQSSIELNITLESKINDRCSDRNDEKSSTHKRN